MEPSAPSTEFPGNIFFYTFFFGFLAFFFWSAGVRFRWFTKAQWANRFTARVGRTAGLIPWLLGNARVARPRYWYSGVLHSLIWWGFIVLQIRTLNFLLNGIDHDLSFESIIGDPYVYVMWPTMALFNILVIVGG